MSGDEGLNELPFMSFVFLLPDWVCVDSIIEPQDVEAEKAHDKSVDSGHQPADMKVGQAIREWLGNSRNKERTKSRQVQLVLVSTWGFK